MEDSIERESAALIGEIHHRFKNNLQVIISLFTLQQHRTTRPEVLEMLGRMQNRIRVVSYLYEQLGGTHDPSTILLGECLNHLVSGLEAFYDRGKRVEVLFSGADLALDIDQALPLALIANELLSNAFQHAFPDNYGGKISVALRYSSTNMGELQVVDTGVGLPQDFDLQVADSLGFHVVKILTRQLAGKLAVNSESGTSISLSFPLKEERGEQERQHLDRGR